jgi:hypothetical protein
MRKRLLSVNHIRGISDDTHLDIGELYSMSELFSFESETCLFSQYPNKTKTSPKVDLYYFFSNLSTERMLRTD